jgi:hypothetical protein
MLALYASMKIPIRWKSGSVVFVMNIMKFNVALLGVVLLTSNLYAQGGPPPPSAIFTVDDENIQLPAPVLNEEGDWELAITEPIDIRGPSGALEAQITSLGALFDQDPFISYGVAVIDFGAPSAFGFAFGTPIVPTSSPGTASASFSASVTDGTSGVVDFIALPPGVPTDGAPDEAQVFNVGLPLANPGLDLGPTVLGVPLVGGSGVVGPFAASGVLPAGTFTWLQLDLNFSGSGGGDIYTLNGRGEITESVPDAANTFALALFGLGLCIVGQWRARFCTR